LAPGRKRVLVAERDDIVLALISHILTRQGYLVDNAATADQIKACLRANSYDAILIDASLPGGAIEWLRSAVPDGERRLVILASHSIREDVPARAVLQKPIEFHQLVETVAACVTQTD
jgi:DNA-binding response OmpR family regulator